MNNTNKPSIRYRRLSSDYTRLKKLADNSPFIHIKSTIGNPPYEYIVLFTCKGITSLGTLGPKYGNEHQVLIHLPRDYPLREPHMRFLTPIVHPNINSSGTHVCIDIWYPSKFLDDLCLMLGRMIQYQNFNPHNPLEREIASWTVQNNHLLPVDDRPLQYGQKDQLFPETFNINILD